MDTPSKQPVATPAVKTTIVTYVGDDTEYDDAQ